MTAQLHLSLGSEITDGELLCGMPFNESCLRITKFGGDLQHQILLRESVRIEQNHSRWVTAKRLVGESVNNEVFHQIRCIKVLLSYNYLLRLHVVAVNEAQHVNARCHPVCRDAIGSAEFTFHRVSRQNDAPRHVNHLKSNDFSIP